MITCWHRRSPKTTPYQGNSLYARLHPLQDEEDGGISDRPEDMADIYHTYFGIAGLSLMGYPGLVAIDPTWALPVDVVARLKQRHSSKVIS